MKICIWPAYYFRYARSQPSPSSTEETAGEETTETDSQAPVPDPRQILQVDPYQQAMLVLGC